jgi:predicted CopG family antitoxin
MASKTISVSTAAYNRLRTHRRGVGDSFSRVIMRAHWADETVTAGELLESAADAPFHVSEDALERIAELKTAQEPPVDKWSSR